MVLGRRRAAAAVGVEDERRPAGGREREVVAAHQTIARGSARGAGTREGLLRELLGDEAAVQADEVAVDVDTGIPEPLSAGSNAKRTPISSSSVSAASWIASACSSDRTSRRGSRLVHKLDQPPFQVAQADVADLEGQVEVAAISRAFASSDGSGDCRRYRTSVQWSK